MVNLHDLKFHFSIILICMDFVFDLDLDLSKDYKVILQINLNFQKFYLKLFKMSNFINNLHLLNLIIHLKFMILIHIYFYDIIILILRNLLLVILNLSYNHNLIFYLLFLLFNLLKLLYIDFLYFYHIVF